jgi:hypothetical protein
LAGGARERHRPIVRLQLVRQPGADGGDAGADVIELGAQVRELLFYQRRALVRLDSDLASTALGNPYQLGSLIVGLLLGSVKRVEQRPTSLGERSRLSF